MSNGIQPPYDDHLSISHIYVLNKKEGKHSIFETCGRKGQNVLSLHIFQRSVLPEMSNVTFVVSFIYSYMCTKDNMKELANYC